MVKRVGLKDRNYMVAMTNNGLLLIAIDGPSASGKGTLAKKVAQHFNLPYLNTGALYRLVAYRILQQKIDPNDFVKNIAHLTASIVESDLDNEELFNEEVGSVASIIARNQKLRIALFDFQKNFVVEGRKKYNGCVIEGRDTTTVVCPEANYKFFVTADVEIRAKRRFEQLQGQGKKVSYDEILAQLKQRDASDLNRETSPLKIAKDAVVIDNGMLSIAEGVGEVLKKIKN